MIDSNTIVTAAALPVLEVGVDATFRHARSLDAYGQSRAGRRKVSCLPAAAPALRVVRVDASLRMQAGRKHTDSPAGTRIESCSGCSRKHYLLFFIV